MKVFIYCDIEIKVPSTGYDLVLHALSGEDLWEQVEEIISLCKTKKDDSIKFDFRVRGVIGLKPLQQIRSLAERGSVVWEIDKESVESLREHLVGLKNVTVNPL